MPNAQTVREAMEAAAKAQRENSPAEAIAGLTQALALHEATGETMPGTVYFVLGKLLYEAGRLAEAEVVARKGLAKRPKEFDLNNLMGVLLKNLGRPREALSFLDAAQKANPKSLSPYINKGNALMDLDDAKGAVAIYWQIIRMAPKLGEYHRLLGVALRKAGDFAGARRSLEQACSLAPGELKCFLDLAWFLEESGQSAEADAVLLKSLARFGPRPQLVRHRAKVLRRSGRVQEAGQWLQGLIQAGCREPAAFLELAFTVKALATDKANPIFAQALQLAPNDVETIMAYADNLQRTRGADEARNIQKAYELALHRLTLGGDLRESGQALFYILIRCADYANAQRLGSFTELGGYWARRGQLTALHALMAQVKTHQDRRDLLDWHRLCGAEEEALAARVPLPPEAPQAAPPARRTKIRIGLVSSDLRDHPVSYFVAPLIEHLDRSRFEFYCYSWYNQAPDPVQKHLAAQVAAFRHAPNITARDAAALIRTDAVDVLFELGGTTHMNKIEIMAHRPAKRQASWLGYPHSAGYASIDRILVDPYILPEDPALLLEKPFQVAHSWVTFNTLGFGKAPEINPVTPQERTGQLTFGTMNNPYKYNLELLTLWAGILRASPGSRLLFVRPEGAVAAFRANLERLFAGLGVEPSRLAYVPVRGAHLPYYNDIDVALDTFPQTGGTTTCECLWMGVPVVSLAGEAFFERLSHSNLHNAGLGELVTWTPEAYEAKALEVAADTAWRGEFRRTARERIKANPLGNPALFTRDFEDAISRWMDEPAP